MTLELILLNSSGLTLGLRFKSFSFVVINTIFFYLIGILILINTEFTPSKLLKVPEAFASLRFPMSLFLLNFFIHMRNF